MGLFDAAYVCESCKRETQKLNAKQACQPLDQLVKR